MKYDEIINSLYSDELISDTLAVIMQEKYTKLPELFEMDSLFNSYVQAMKELEFLVSGLKLFEPANAEEIEKAIENCADVALIQAYAAEIVAKHASLLTKGVNVYTEMRKIDSEKADNFFCNIDFIKQKVAKMMSAETEVPETVASAELPETTTSISRKMYILDTCALIHHPEILLSFKEDEYVRIPTKVIDELGKIKDKRSVKYSAEVARTAARLANDIERRYLKLFNYQNKMRLMIENAELDLLPEDLDRAVPDNQILSVALKYRDWNPIIISDDGVFRLTSLAQNIQAQKSEDFLKEHEIYKKSLEKWVEKFEKAGGRLVLQSNVPLAKPKHVAQAEYIQNDKSEALLRLEQGRFEDEMIDELPIRELKRYIPSELTEPVFALLQSNGVKTIGKFKTLTTKDVEGFKAKGKQAVFKNNISRALVKFRNLVMPSEAETESK